MSTLLFNLWSLFPSRLYSTGFALTLCLFLIPGTPRAFADEPAQTAVVLFTFGTTYDQKVDPLKGIQAEIRNRHPGMEIRVAYSSSHVLNTLRIKGRPARSLAQALSDLSSEGYTQVVVQSLHVIPGMEFEIASDIASRFRDLPKGIDRVVMGEPLLASHQDVEKVASVLLESLPAERGPADAAIFIGHGAANGPGSLAYPALQSLLGDLDTRLFVGTIEGPYEAEGVLEKVRRAGTAKVYLVPLLNVIGDHADNDIFGDQEDSWFSQFSEAGYQAIKVRRGLYESPGLIGIWADHLDRALASLDR